MRLAEAQREIAEAQYQKAIQTAFTEVPNALIAHQKVQEARAKQEGLVAVLEERKRLAYMALSTLTGICCKPSWTSGRSS